MKHILIAAALLSCIGMRAQNTGIDSVLRQIEANQQGIASQCTAYLLAEAGKQDREQSA